MAREETEKKKSEKKKSDIKKSDVIIGIIIILVVILFVGTLVKVFLGLISNKGGKTKDTAAVATVDKVIMKNLDSQYPATPTALAKFYCSVTQELHRKGVTDEQVEKLYGQLRKLFDEELLENNEYSKHLKALKNEVKEYKDKRQYITRYEVADKDDVTIYVDEEGYDCTKVQIRFSIKSGSKWLYSTEELVLRKNDDGRWKVLGYKETATEKSDDDD